MQMKVIMNKLYSVQCIHYTYCTLNTFSDAYITRQVFKNNMCAFSLYSDEYDIFIRVRFFPAQKLYSKIVRYNSMILECRPKIERDMNLKKALLDTKFSGYAG